MGVPAFYRWLRDKYPKSIEEVVEEEPATVDGVEVPVSFRGPNPNGFEFDNLYLDMNGIIHPCVHPEDVPAPTTEEEMFLAITAYIDRLVYAIRPRKVLFMAIDGVAPRAKMNQQRSRRFKAAQDMAEEEEVEEELRSALKARGQKVPPKKKSSFDHNVITPGTRFMDRLARHLMYYIHDRLSNNGDWRGLRVVLSDASVPGEGEHKIMEFIRQQRAQPGYHPNTRHCLHGLDADLIMLGLATHEAHFTICREDVLGKGGAGGGGGMKCHACGREGHRAEVCTGYIPPPPQATAQPDVRGPGGRVVAHSTAADDAGRPDGDSLTSIRSLIARKPLHFLHLSTLREYLALEFGSLAPSLPFGYDIERVIDDFVFMCFFVGNDFLPHLPSLDIREGAIDLLLALYRQLLPSLGGYLTEEGGNVVLSRADVLLSRVGGVEDEIFRRRRSKEDKDKVFDDRRKAERAGGGGAARAAEELPDHARVVLSALTEGVSAIAGRSSSDVVEAKLRHIAVAGTEAAAVDRAAGRVHGSAGHAAAHSVTLTASVAAPAPAAVAQPSTKEADNRTAAASLRAQLLGLARPIKSFIAEEMQQAQHAAGGKRKREGEGEAPSTSDGAPGTPVSEPPAKQAHREGADGDERPAAEADTGAADGDVDVDVDDIFGAPLGEEEVAAARAGEDAGASAAAAAADALIAAGGPDASLTPSAALEAEALEEGLLEPAAAVGVKGMLKSAVLKALLAKRSREQVEDGVRFGSAGWKDRYYTSKFGAESAADAGFRSGVYKSYVEGLVWVFRYYYAGVASWKWFYPYHYAPFASDLRGLDTMTVAFDLGKPFRPLDQLMGVLPPRSSHALPPACAAMMNDPSSSIADFYPARFAMDPNGKRFTWQWVVLLPFIDEARLVAAVDSVAGTLSPEERKRNSWGHEMLFSHHATPLGRLLAPLTPALGAPDAAAGGGDDAGAGEPDDPTAPAPAASSSGSSAPAADSDSPKAGVNVILDIVPVSPSAVRVTLTPRDGDDGGKGFTGTAVSLRDGRAGLRGMCAVPLGGTYPSPWRPVLADVERNSAVAVSLLPPPRRVHACAMLPGAQEAAPLLHASEDDPTGRVPRLTKGMNIADLAYMGADGGRGRGDRGGDRRGGGGYGGGGGGGPYQQQHQQQSQYPQQGHGQQQAQTTYGQAHAAVYGGGGGGQYQQPYQQQPYQQQQQQQAQGSHVRFDSSGRAYPSAPLQPPPPSFGYGGGGMGGYGMAMQAGQGYGMMMQPQQQAAGGGYGAPPPAAFGYGGMAMGMGMGALPQQQQAQPMYPPPQQQLLQHAPGYGGGGYAGYGGGGVGMLPPPSGPLLPMMMMGGGGAGGGAYGAPGMMPPGLGGPAGAGQQRHSFRPAGR